MHLLQFLVDFSVNTFVAIYKFISILYFWLIYICEEIFALPRVTALLLPSAPIHRLWKWQTVGRSCVGEFAFTLHIICRFSTIWQTNYIKKWYYNRTRGTFLSGMPWKTTLCGKSHNFFLREKNLLLKSSRWGGRYFF